MHLIKNIILKNLFEQHPFHLVNSSLWPLFISFSLMNLTFSFLLYFNFYKNSTFFLVISFCLFLFFLCRWFFDIVIELTYEGYHTNTIQTGLRFGMVMFFVFFFWAFLSRSDLFSLSNILHYCFEQLMWIIFLPLIFGFTIFYYKILIEFNITLINEFFLIRLKAINCMLFNLFEQFDITILTYLTFTDLSLNNNKCSFSYSFLFFPTFITFKRRFFSSFNNNNNALRRLRRKIIIKQIKNSSLNQFALNFRFKKRFKSTNVLTRNSWYVHNNLLRFLISHHLKKNKIIYILSEKQICFFIRKLKKQKSFVSFFKPVFLIYRFFKKKKKFIVLKSNFKKSNLLKILFFFDRKKKLIKTVKKCLKKIFFGNKKNLNNLSLLLTGIVFIALIELFSKLKKNLITRSNLTQKIWITIISCEWFRKYLFSWDMYSQFTELLLYGCEERGILKKYAIYSKPHPLQSNFYKINFFLTIPNVYVLENSQIFELKNNLYFQFFYNQFTITDKFLKKNFFLKHLREDQIWLKSKNNVESLEVEKKLFIAINKKNTNFLLNLNKNFINLIYKKLNNKINLLWEITYYQKKIKIWKKTQIKHLLLDFRGRLYRSISLIWKFFRRCF